MGGGGKTGNNLKPWGWPFYYMTWYRDPAIVLLTREWYCCLTFPAFESLVSIHHLVGLRTSSFVSISSFPALNATKLRGISNNPRQNCAQERLLPRIRFADRNN